MTDKMLGHELALIGMTLAATGQEGPAKAVSTAIDRLQSLFERIDVLEGRIRILVWNREKGEGNSDQGAMKAVEEEIAVLSGITPS